VTGRRSWAISNRNRGQGARSKENQGIRISEDQDNRMPGQREREALHNPGTRECGEGVTGKPQVSDFGGKGISDCSFDGVRFKSFPPLTEFFSQVNNE
jgi:hypothetical protein